MEKFMKARLLKRLTLVIGIYLIPIGIVTLGLGSPSYANEQQSEVLTDVAKTPAATMQAINTQTANVKVVDEEHITIALSGEEDGINALSGIISTLIDTEWDQLDESEQAQILEALEQIETGVEIDIDIDHSGFGPGKVLVTIVAILSTLGMPFIIIGLILFYKHRKRRRRDLLISKFIDAGKDVPVEILQGSDGSDEPQGNFQRGIMLTGIGVGLLLFLGILIGWDVASVALIPIFIDLARLLVWKLSSKDKSVKEAE